ncbi:hypothetical protein [Bremerella sp. P1]|uniref:hypothetical protein n=1 Tax=Bremerella sp. P1 TaxID=3026424 RepID=UPI00236766DF|nr:hypothetical protein [Bremerella sp. P1]WDI41361.1 hypothetical protein PSR63_23105 [Bremerella sp. P1]
MSVKTISYFGLLMIVGANMACGQNANQAPSDGAKPAFVPNEAYQTKRQELRNNAMMSVEVAKKHYESGVISFSDVCEINIAALKAQMESAANEEEEVALLSEMLEVIRSLEAVTLSLVEAGRSSQLELTTVSMERLRIELALMRRGVDLPPNKHLADKTLPKVEQAAPLLPGK